MLHALCENCSKTVEEVHEGDQVQDALTLVRGEWEPLYFCTWGCLAQYAMRRHKREREMGFE